MFHDIVYDNFHMYHMEHNNYVWTIQNPVASLLHRSGIHWIKTINIIVFSRRCIYGMSFMVELLGCVLKAMYFIQIIERQIQHEPESGNMTVL